MIGRKYIKFIAVFLAVNFLVQTLGLTITYALTSGPSQPEFSSFEPVATTNMVNPFSGDFTYNLPLLEVPGPHGSSYPISLSYHSGVSAEEEASWVGYGWTLNAGAINRGTQGFPDDYKNDKVTYFNKTPKNWTVTVGGGGSTEIFSSDKWASISANAALRYNNYKGFGKNLGIGLHLGRGFVNMGYNVSDDEGSFSLSIQPGALMKGTEKEGAKKKKDMSEKEKKEHYKNNFANTTLGNSGGVNLVGSNYGIFTMSGVERPTQVPKFNGASYNVSINFEVNPSQFPAGATVNLFGSYSYQENEQFTDVKALGYMYSSDRTDPENQVMDYTVEKENSYNKRDVFLGIPFNSADQYMVTAEGLSGAFRMFHKDLGWFGPRNMKSTTVITNVSPEVDAGLNFGGGVDIGKGSQKMEIGDWGSTAIFSNPEAKEDEPVFFRFNGDLGGSLGVSYIDRPEAAGSHELGAFLPAEFHSLNNGSRIGRSSYIGYNTLADANATARGKYYKAYSKRADIRSLRSSELRDYQIAEIAVYNENGGRYVYGLPVLNRNERHLTMGVNGTVDHNYLAYQNNDKVLLGTEQLTPYASSFLLTEVTTPDYIDRGYDGPTSDDYGGYTRFNYKKLYGSNGENSQWYKWRNPFNGLLYNRGSLSDKKDDTGAVSSGEKEIVYLQSIETKTHVAVFYTQLRNDGVSSVNHDNLSPNQKGSDKLHRLTKIELYSLADFRLQSGQIDRNKIKNPSGATPIKTVHLKYYGYDVSGDELQTGAPNAENGRLSLAKVYFEYNGLNQTRVSPYVFKYEYPKDNTYPAEYDALDNYLGVLAETGAENPPYSAFNSDAWGNYQPNGDAQHDKMRPWIDQSLEPNKDYDPAAWNLKVIQLPSKGEIHVQYEQDDYSFVQDQEAHVMVPLRQQMSEHTFEVDYSQIGVETSDLADLARMIEKRYVGKGKRLYFRFLYKLKDNESPQLKDCDAEFIDGFAKVIGVTHDSDANRLFVTVASDGLPKTVCEDFVKANRLGMINRGSCDAAEGALNNSGDPKGMVMQLLDYVGASLMPNSLCNVINPTYSYFRIPTPKAKKGGGLRVKRLLTFDNSLGEKSLYGTEYIYKTLSDDGRIISSGVATNEPGTISEENILRDFIKRKGQTLVGAMIAGKDKEQAEGPIGASVMPGAAIGYSQVFTKSIHSGATAPGYSVMQYYTAKDYPVKVNMTAIDDSMQKNRIVVAVVMNQYLNHQYATQGFSIIQNQMHGQLHRTATYSGDFPGVVLASSSPMVIEQINEYFSPGEDIPVMDKFLGSTYPKKLGREVDVTIAQKLVEEQSVDVNVEADFTVGMFAAFPVPFLTAMPSSTISESLLATHAITKVIKYPAILKKSISYQDGIYHTTENLAFSEATGQPVATRNYDEYQGAYLSQQIPTYWEYDNFKSKAQNERLYVGSSDLQMMITRPGYMAKLRFSGSGSCAALDAFTTGDLLEFDGNKLYYIKSVNFAKNELELLMASSSSFMFFVPQVIDHLSILRSGRNNQIGQSIASLTFHDSDFTTLKLEDLAITEAERWVYESNTEGSEANGSRLLFDLNNAFDSMDDGIHTLTLSGPYENMNVSQYSINGCSFDPYAAKMKDLIFDYHLESGVVKLSLREFWVYCNEIEDYKLVR